MAARFKHGRLLITAAARDRLDAQEVFVALGRHLDGDWGELSKDDCERDDLALEEGHRLLSAYRDRNGFKFWIITEGDRSQTTVLLPEDY